MIFFRASAAFSLGLERTGGFETVAFCEIERRLWDNLSRHFPGVPIYADIKELSGDRGSADVICGGFPCQPYSTASAGRAKGADDDRALWPEMRRLISEIRPAWVVGENVVGVDALDLERVVSDMEAIGYEVQPFDIPACAVGHDHKRARIWIIGHANEDSEPVGTINGEASRLRYRGPRLEGVDGPHGVSFWMGALGNAVVPQIPELIGRAILEAENAR